MFRTTKTKIVTIALVGAVALGGAIYATTAWATGGANAAPSPASVSQTADQAQLRASALEMLKDRMGITGPEAERLADQMIAAMGNLNPGFDLQDMFDWCAGNGIGGAYSKDNGSTDGGYGYGMMGGYGNGGSGNGGYGYGMMGGYGLR
jgi:hypothetical protein